MRWSLAALGACTPLVYGRVDMDRDMAITSLKKIQDLKSMDMTVGQSPQSIHGSWYGPRGVGMPVAARTNRLVEQLKEWPSLAC